MNCCNIWCWNVRGLNKEKKQEVVIKVCQKKEIGVGAFVETKLKSEKVKKMMSKNFCGLDSYTSPAIEGRLLLIWKKTFARVIVIEETSQYVHCYVKLASHTEAFCVTFMYGMNGLEERKLLWKGLANLRFPVRTWILLVDFNSLVNFGDRVGGKPVSMVEIEDFNDWLSLGMVDSLKRQGSFFTWSNNQGSKDRIYSRIDHAFKNKEWLDLFPNSSASFSWEEVSDHCVIVITSAVMVEIGVKPLGNVELEFQKAKDKFLEARFQAQSNPGVEIMEEKDVADSFHLHEKNAEKFPCPKEEENTIASFVDLHGNIVDNYPDVVRHYIDHFKSYMGSYSSVTRRLDTDCFENGNRLTLNQQLRLIQSFSNKEIKEALFSIPSSKSPGPDGYNSEFFKAIWTDIGAEVCFAIKEFFNTGKIPVQFNETVISLIPKDLIKNYGRKNVSPRCAIKIDLNKAYDTVDWGFVEDLLVGLNFPSKFVDWIMKCLRGTSYTIMLNGRFHDDLILFSKGSSSAVHHLKIALASFSDVTGLYPNKDKSLVYFGGVSLDEKEVILEDLQFSEGSFLLKYLRVPLRPTKWRREDCDAIIKKIKMRLVTWATRHLSYAGRIQLIHSVLFGLRNYWMSIFILPQSVIKEVVEVSFEELRGIEAKFIWPLGIRFVFPNLLVVLDSRMALLGIVLFLPGLRTTAGGVAGLLAKNLV
uniref:Reverse transcriptase domain-containing protein n=1 Tax=Cannabis sativa TaxID=3483 RepID=A0A803P9Z7_CANSA